ncbi:MAG: YqaA family protein [Paludibacteraceae bacterium]
MLTDFAEYGYAGLFLATFLAATILPFSSEVVFSALVFGGLNAWMCVLCATFGNWLGGLTCYWLGHLGKIEWIEKWLRVSHDKIERARSWFRRYGDWVAFFSFLPVVGDIIAVAAGFMRCNFWIASTAMLFGKFARYLLWMYIHGLLF